MKQTSVEHSGLLSNGSIDFIPKTMGGYRFGKRPSHYIQINLTYKPNWFHRTMMGLCFGLYWFDEKKD